MAEPVVWRESFRVRAYEVDAAGRASVPAIANWLQEAAGNHATALGWAVDALRAQGRTWVLARLHLRLSRAPGWREAVRVSTWPSGAHRVFALREFRLAGADDHELGVATTGWILLDLAGQRPVRPPEAIRDIARAAPGRVLADDFARLPDLDAAAEGTRFEVRASELDMNRHANNVSVIAWALDALPRDLVLGAPLAELEIEFRSEALLGERVRSEVQRVTPAEFLHRIVREGDSREVARARTAWGTSDPLR